MERDLDRSVPVHVDPEQAIRTFTSGPGVWLPEPAELVGPATWVISLHAGMLVRRAECTVGNVWSREGSVARRVRWTPIGTESDLLEAEQLLPGFEGSVRLTPGEDMHVALELEGHYDPPGGVLGVVLDAALMHGVARSTAKRFLQDIGEKLAASHRESVR